MKSGNKEEGFVHESEEDDGVDSSPQMLRALGFVNSGGGRKYSRAESSTLTHDVSFLALDPGALLTRCAAGIISGTSGDRLLENPELLFGVEEVRSNSLGRGFLLALKLLKLKNKELPLACVGESGSGCSRAPPIILRRYDIIPPEDVSFLDVLISGSSYVECFGEACLLLFGLFPM